MTVICILLVTSLHLKISAESAGITTEQVWLTTPDGVRLNAQLYKPTAHSEPMPGIVVCHGLAACHQMMQTSFSREFARRGFYVIAIDLRGHGDSGGGIEISFNILLGGFPHRDEISISTFFNVTKVDLDVRTGVDYLLSRTEVDPDKIAILGHSLGGAAVFMEGYSDPRVKSVVAIAPVISPHSGMNLTAPSSLLLAVGGKDGVIRRADLVEVLSTTTGGGEEVGKLYGNFSDGTARQMIVSEGTDHAGEMFDTSIVEQSITWVEASLGIDSILPISISPWQRLVIPLLVIASLLSVFPAMLVVKELRIIRNNKPSQKSQSIRMSGKKIIFTYWAAWGGSLLVGMPLQILGVFKWIPVPFLGIVVTTSLLFFGILLIMRRSDNSFSLNVHEVKTGASLGMCGFLVVFLILNVVFTQSFLDLLPTPRELSLMIALSCLLLPLTLLEEVWLRTLQLRLSQTPWMKIGIPLILYLSTKMVPLASVSFMFGNLVLLASSLLVIPILLTTVLFHENGSVVGGAVFNALLYAWIIAVVLPFGTNTII